MTSIAIYGAYSAIAEATARRLATPDSTFFLVGRDPERLKAMADDLTVRGAGAVHTRAADLVARPLEGHRLGRREVLGDEDRGVLRGGRLGVLLGAQLGEDAALEIDEVDIALPEELVLQRLELWVACY